MSFRLIPAAATLVAAAGLVACAQPPGALPGATAKAMLRPTTAPGAAGVSADVTLVQQGATLVVSGTARGLKPGAEHGFHVHQNGDCSGDGSAAGDHFNPDAHAHGNPAQLQRHAGDLFNLRADASGTATFRQEVTGIALTPGKTSVMNRALVIHGGPDDYTSQPAGNSGPRLACGVIG